MLHLVLGPTRSGKSATAERLLASLPAPRAYVATWIADPADREMAGRIDAHRSRRPADWAIHELASSADLVPLVGAVEGSLLVDGLGTWLSGSPTLEVDGEALAAALVARQGDTLVVSEEVGWSLHAATEVGRRFVDRLGTLNQRIAAVADRVTLVVAGRALELGPAIP